MMDPYQAILFHMRERDRLDQSWAESEAMLEDSAGVDAYHRPRLSRHNAELERLAAEWPDEYERAEADLQTEYEREA